MMKDITLCFEMYVASYFITTNDVALFQISFKIAAFKQMRFVPNFELA